jgi:hypothetical protein
VLAGSGLASRKQPSVAERQIVEGVVQGAGTGARRTQSHSRRHVSDALSGKLCHPVKRWTNNHLEAN